MERMLSTYAGMNNVIVERRLLLNKCRLHYFTSLSVVFVSFFEARPVMIFSDFMVARGLTLSLFAVNIYFLVVVFSPYGVGGKKSDHYNFSKLQELVIIYQC